MAGTGQFSAYGSPWTVSDAFGGGLDATQQNYMTPSGTQIGYVSGQPYWNGQGVWVDPATGYNSGITSESGGLSALYNANPSLFGNETLAQVLGSIGAGTGGTPTSNLATSGSGTGSTSTGMTPAYIQSQFPNGIPSITPQTIDPSAAVAATQAYLAPQFQQQNQALTANLANAGIVGGTTAQALASLGQQQQTTLQNNVQPYLQSAALANQSTNLQGQTTNAQNLLQTAGLDANTYNAMLQYIAGLQNQDWLAQLGATTNIATAGMGAQTNAFNPVYTQPSTINMSGLGAAFAPSANNSTTSDSAPYVNYTGAGASNIGGG